MSAIIFAVGNVLFISAIFYEKINMIGYPYTITSAIWDSVTLKRHSSYHFNIMLCIGCYLMLLGVLLKTIIRCLNNIYYWVKRP